MAITEFLKHFGERGKERKEKFKEADENFQIQKVIEQRQKSANERELETYDKIDREKMIKRVLEAKRKEFDYENNYGHNPLFVPNITNKSDYNLLKQKKLFTSKKNLFSNQQFIHKDNKKLLNNGKILKC